MDETIRSDARARRAYGHGYEHLVGKWIFFFGARKNFRGFLMDLIPGTFCKFIVAPLYEVDISNNETVQQEEQLTSVTKECPAVILESACQLLMCQPPSWPES